MRSDRDGSSSSSACRPAEYTLEGGAPGFATVPRQRVRGGPGRLDSRSLLTVGSLEETLTVSSNGTPAPPRRVSPAEAQAALARLQSRRGIGDCPAASNVGGNIRAPRKLDDVKPTYPESLSATRTSGAVEMDAVIGVDGLIREVKTVSATHPEFERAAVDAVRQWEFDTTLLNCEPIEVTMKVRARSQIQP